MLGYRDGGGGCSWMVVNNNGHNKKDYGYEHLCRLFTYQHIFLLMHQVLC